MMANAPRAPLTASLLVASKGQGAVPEAMPDLHLVDNETEREGEGPSQSVATRTPNKPAPFFPVPSREAPVPLAAMTIRIPAEMGEDLRRLAYDTRRPKGELFMLALDEFLVRVGYRSKKG